MTTTTMTTTRCRPSPSTKVGYDVYPAVVAVRFVDVVVSLARDAVLESDEIPVPSPATRPTSQQQPRARSFMPVEPPATLEEAAAELFGGLGAMMGLTSVSGDAARGVGGPGAGVGPGAGAGAWARPRGVDQLM
jgi:hypothetical protein